MQNNFGRYFFYALGHGAIGFSPFGVDYTGWTISDEKIPAWLSEDFALFEPIASQVAQLNFDGKLQTAIEENGQCEDAASFRRRGRGGLLRLSAARWRDAARER